jgi:hypothetical protein
MIGYLARFMLDETNMNSDLIGHASRCTQEALQGLTIYDLRVKFVVKVKRTSTDPGVGRGKGVRNVTHD